MLGEHPGFKRTDNRFPYTSLFRSGRPAPGGRASGSSPVVKGNGDRIEPLALPLSQRTEASAPRLFVNAPDSGDLSANSITAECFLEQVDDQRDRKSTRLNSSH